LGFTPDKFEGYLWLTDRAIYISLVVSLDERKGHVRGLIDRILASGYTVKVPVPSVRMESILRRKGFTQTWEPGELGACEVWVKAPEEDGHDEHTAAHPPT
jgi:hypothetical protein